jgi:hypothetical protein
MRWTSTTNTEAEHNLFNMLVLLTIGRATSLPQPRVLEDILGRERFAPPGLDRTEWPWMAFRCTSPVTLYTFLGKPARRASRLARKLP